MVNERGKIQSTMSARSLALESLQVVAGMIPDLMEIMNEDVVDQSTRRQGAIEYERFKWLL